MITRKNGIESAILAKREGVPFFEPAPIEESVKQRYIGAIIAAAATIASTAYAVSSQQSIQYPNLSAANVETANAQAAALPIQRALAAAEQQGGSAQIPGTHGQDQQEVFVGVRGTPQRGHPAPSPDTPSGYLSGQWVTANPNDPAQAGLPTRSRTVQVSNGTQSFAGYGTADIEGQLAQRYAQIQNDLGQRYGVQFAHQAAADVAQADPLGTQARAAENQMIQDSINNPPPINPLSPELESQIDSQLKAGSGLDSMSRDLLDQAVTRANAARGGSTSADDVATQMSQGNSGQARLQTAEQKAGSFLSSGATPEDIQYRRNQQNLANVGAFVGGTTPESQFGSLSTAGQGATPFVPGQQLPSLPGNAGASGSPYSIASYEAQVRQGQTQTSPWLAGLTSLLTGAGAGINAASTGG